MHGCCSSSRTDRLIRCTPTCLNISDASDQPDYPMPPYAGPGTPTGSFRDNVGGEHHQKIDDDDLGAVYVHEDGDEAAYSQAEYAQPQYARPLTPQGFDVPGEGPSRQEQAVDQSNFNRPPAFNPAFQPAPVQASAHPERQHHAPAPEERTSGDRNQYRALLLRCDQRCGF